MADPYVSEDDRETLRFAAERRGVWNNEPRAFLRLQALCALGFLEHNEALTRDVHVMNPDLRGYRITEAGRALIGLPTQG